MLRSVDGWEGEHFSFDAGSAAATAVPTSPTTGPTQIAIDNGSDGPSATIPDSHLLFTAQFSRAGADLVLTGEDGKAFVVHDYFANDVHARLLSAEGAALSPDVVAALAGPLAPGQYAQAGAAQPSVKAVGRVVQADGDATIVRNGVAMAAHAGDAVLKGDVLQTVTGTFGVTFNDGSTLNLTANSRLVVNEFVYDPNGSANSQLLDLVQGSLTFISGEVAHNGDMKIGTPVATMAIRGTVGGVTTANDGTVHFYVSQSATGAVILDSRGAVIANVVQDGPLIVVRPVGPLQVLAEEVQKSPAQLATELAALQQIVSIQSVGQQIIQQFFQQDPNANPNPQSTDRPHTQFQIDLHTNDPTGPNNTPGQNDGNPPPPTSATVTQTPTDGDGHGTTPVEVTIPANLPPLTFAPLQQAANEDTALVFSSAHGNAISVFDADTASLTVTVAVTHGVVSLSGVTGLTFTSGDGSGDATMIFSGTQDAINAALEGMSFTPETEYSGAASVSVTTSDGHSTSATDTIEITVAAINDAPVIAQAESPTLAYTENQAATAIDTALTLSDVDSATLSGATVTISGHFHAGEDVLSFVDQNGITGSYDSESGVLTLSGVASVADYQAALQSVAYANSSDDPSADTRTISYQVDDGSADNHLSNVATASVTVAPVNDVPVLEYFNLAVSEGGTTVLSPNDFHIADPDSSDFFFSVTGVTGGQFEVLTGENWVAAPTGGFTTDDITAGHVRFVHDGGETAPDFTVWASDGTDAGEPIDPTVDFTIVNHAPTITSGNSGGGPDQIQHETSIGLSLDETDGVRGLATDGTLLYVNDNGGEIDIYTLAGSFVESHAVDNLAGGSNQMTFADGHLYARNGDTIFLISTQDWSSTAVSAPEDHGLLTAKSWMTEDMLSLPDGRIGVLGANEDDTTTLRLYTVGEDGLSLTWSEDIILQTDGQPGDNHGSASDGTYIYIADYQLNGYRSYSLATGELVYTSGDITDSGTGADVQNPTFLTHDHVNGEYIFGSYDIPVAQLSAGGSNSILVAENTTAVMTVTASDADAGTTLTYSIAGGADSALFDINASTGVLTFTTAPDYEAPADQGADNIYDVVVQVSDGALTDSKALTVRVTNVDDGPPSPEAGSASVSEEGLSRGVADQAGSGDTTDNAVATGTIASTGGGQLHFSLGLPTTELSSGGHPVSWTLDEQGTLAGKVGTETIITVSINDNGDYTVTLLGPVDHPDTNAEDVKDLNIPVSVSNELGTATTTLTVNIEDDSPAAAAVSKTVVPGAPQDFNVAFALDYSGSIDNGELNTMLSAVKSAAQAIFDGTSVQVTITVVAFAASATTLGTFDSYAALESAIDATNPSLSGHRPNLTGGTNFDSAIAQLLAHYSPVEGAKNEVFFLSDGQSSVSTTASAWHTFVTENSIDVTAIGIGDGISPSGLQSVDVDGSGAPILVGQFSGLVDSLLSLVDRHQGGNIFTGSEATVGFGADGGHIQSIVVDGYTYTWDGNNTITKTGGEAPESLAGSSIVVTTELGGTFKFTFGAGSGHVAGDWSYAPPADPNLNAIETFHYVLIDNDGDHAAADIAVTVDGIGNMAPVLANVAPDAAYTENGGDALLAPDLTVTDIDSAMLASAKVTITGGHVPGDLLYTNAGGTNIVAIYNDTTGVLQLSGADTPAHYQQVLQSVRFASYSDDPTNGGADSSRTIDWQVGSSFEAQTKFDAGLNVYAMTTGDVNGDGKTDLVVSSMGDRTISVMLGNGDGTFQPLASFPVGRYATGIAIADMNGDGKADIVAANLNNGNVSVIFGAGDGTFQAPVVTSIGYSPYAVATADLDGDGNTDIVTANYGNNNVSVLFGNGDGTFHGQTQYETGATPQYVAFADFNADGKLDLVTANLGSSDVSVLLGNGDGTFQGETRFATGAGPASLMVADLNADGKLDLVTADLYDATVSVLFGAGDGTFGSATTYAAGLYPAAVMLGDVNADGKADLVAVNRGDNSVSVLLGNGDGTFQAQTASDVVGGGAIAAALLDLNGDGRPDLITANNGENNVSVLIGNDTNLSAVQHSTIDVTAVNDAPVNVLPEPASAPNLIVAGGFALDQYLAVVPDSLPDWEDYQAGALNWMQTYAAGAAPMQTTLSIGHGILTVTGIHGALVTGSGTDTVVITGTQTQIDDTLHQSNNIIYTSASDFSGTDTLTMTTTDLGNFGTGGAQTAVNTLDIIVNAAPSVTLSPAENAVYVQNADPLLITSPGNLITDADGSQLFYAVVKLTNAHDGDALSVIGDMPAGITATDYNAVSGSITLYGLADHAAYQDALSHIAFSNDTIYPGSADRVIEVTVNDGAVNSNAASLTINVVDTDDPPVAHNDNIDAGNGQLADFTFNPDTGHWYKVDSTSLTWSAAQAAAIAAGGYLATITSAGENAFIENLRQQAGVPYLWIGASDAAHEGQWVWTGGPESGQQFWQGIGIDDGGIALGYANWGGNEPNNSGGSEDAAHMQGGGTWNDMNAGNQLASVIEASFFVENRTSIISASSLLANDRDEGSMTINAVDDSGAHGTVTILENGDLQYVPDLDFYGAESFTYTARDAAGHVSNAATVNFTVSVVTDPAISWAAPDGNDNIAFTMLNTNGGAVSVDWGDESTSNGGTGFGHSYALQSSCDLNISVDGNSFADYHVVTMPALGEGSSGYVEGTSGNDILIGSTEAPANTFQGNAGNDVMFATASIDTFIFAPNSGHDTVVGFHTDAQPASHDIIDISGFGIFDFDSAAKQAFLDSAVDTAQGLQFAQGNDSLLLAGVHSLTVDHLQGTLAG